MQVYHEIISELSPFSIEKKKKDESQFKDDSKKKSKSSSSSASAGPKLDASK